MRKPVVVLFAVLVSVAVLWASFDWWHALPAREAGTPEKVVVPGNSFGGVSNVMTSTTEAAPASGASTQRALGATLRNAPQIARNGSAYLFVANVDDAATAFSELARREGGSLFALQISNADQGAASATLQVRVPADRFDDTMTALGKIGKVRDRSVGAQDLTDDLSDSTARLQNLRETEADVRKIMDREGDISDVLQAESQLSEVRGQIEELEAQIRTMRGRVSYATIDVTMRAEAGTAPIEPEALAQLATTWQNATHSLVQTTLALIAILLWLVVYVPYLTVAAVVAVLIARRVAARRPA